MRTCELWVVRLVRYGGGRWPKGAYEAVGYAGRIPRPQLTRHPFILDSPKFSFFTSLSPQSCISLAYSRATLLGVPPRVESSRNSSQSRSSALDKA